MWMCIILKRACAISANCSAGSWKPRKAAKSSTKPGAPLTSAPAASGRCGSRWRRCSRRSPRSSSSEGQGENRMHGIAGVKYPSEAAGDAGSGRAGPLQTFDVTRLSSVIYESRGDRAAEVAVIIPLYNYAHTIVEALDSVVTQDLAQLSVAVVNDCSADSGEKRAIAFLERHAERFAE